MKALKIMKTLNETIRKMRNFQMKEFRANNAGKCCPKMQ